MTEWWRRVSRAAWLREKRRYAHREVLYSHRRWRYWISGKCMILRWLMRHRWWRTRTEAASGRGRFSVSAPRRFMCALPAQRRISWSGWSEDVETHTKSYIMSATRSWSLFLSVLIWVRMWNRETRWLLFLRKTCWRLRRRLKDEESKQALSTGICRLRRDRSR